MVRKLTFITILLLAFSQIYSQEEKKEKKVYEHFRATRIINLQSTETLRPGVLELKILHRFGAVTQGASNFFGLDIATMRIALEQGITENLMIGVGRSTFQKTYDGFFKYNFLDQEENGSPLAISLFSSIYVNTVPVPKDRENFFSSKLSYVTQVIMSSKINDRVSLQVSPTVIHKNLVQSVDDKNTTFALAFATKYNVNKKMSLNLEYVARIKQGVDTPAYNDNNNSLSVGWGIDTRGHFFEFHLTNSMPMSENLFITNTTDSWLKGDIHPGFNIVRDFRTFKRRK